MAVRPIEDRATAQVKNALDIVATAEVEQARMEVLSSALGFEAHSSRPLMEKQGIAALSDSAMGVPDIPDLLDLRDALDVVRTAFSEQPGIEPELTETVDAVLYAEALKLDRYLGVKGE